MGGPDRSNEDVSLRNGGVGRVVGVGRTNEGRDPKSWIAASE
jgi:hypothetical protein